jgi:hypothetical protein
MTPTPPDQWSTGRLVPATADVPGTIEVDCSNWEADIPAGEWSTGQFISACQSTPGLAGDFATADRAGIADAKGDAPRPDAA